jgi:parvulin-like peptidyl-prolyl isomerase
MEQQLERLAPLEQLQRHWFATAATSLFLQRRANLDQVVFSLLQLDDAELAQELYFRLQAAEADFPQLAHHSSGPEREQGGRLGPLSLSQLSPLVAGLLRRAQPGTVLPPVELDDGQILLLRLDLLMPARQSAAIESSLRQELYNSWLQGEQERLLAAGPAPGDRLSLELPGPLPELQP